MFSIKDTLGPHIFACNALVLLFESKNVLCPLCGTAGIQVVVLCWATAVNKPYTKLYVWGAYP